MGALNYTKGKWKGDRGTVVSLNSEYEIEHVIARHVSDNDINLIAAAPEMCEALKEAVGCFGSLPSPLIEKMKKALIKAEGY